MIASIGLYITFQRETSEIYHVNYIHYYNVYIFAKFCSYFTAHISSSTEYETQGVCDILLYLLLYTIFCAL